MPLPLRGNRIQLRPAPVSATLQNAGYLHGYSMDRGAPPALAATGMDRYEVTRKLPRKSRENDANFSVRSTLKERVKGIESVESFRNRAYLCMYQRVAASRVFTSYASRCAKMHFCCRKLSQKFQKAAGVLPVIVASPLNHSRFVF